MIQRRKPGRPKQYRRGDALTLSAATFERIFAIGGELDQTQAATVRYLIRLGIEKHDSLQRERKRRREFRRREREQPTP